MYYVPQEEGEAQDLADKIAPRLQHANSSVVLTAVKVIIYLSNYIANADNVSALYRKLSPPLGMQLAMATNQMT